MIKLTQLVRDERGATLLEYIILVGVIALLAIGAFRAFGSSVSAKITEQTTTVGGIETGAQ
jgi:pilus assembly protein Flp/PilA